LVFKSLETGRWWRQTSSRGRGMKKGDLVEVSGRSLNGKNTVVPRGWLGVVHEIKGSRVEVSFPDPYKVLTFHILNVHVMDG